MVLCFWVVNKERLQQPVYPEDFMITVALNQAQIMRQQLEDDAWSSAKTQPKLPDKFETDPN